MQRRYDLDWLRVIAFGLLMLFHTGMMFSTWDWHVKNLETSDAFDTVMRFLHQWRMPLLFFISGSAVWFAMERYSTWKFFLERHKRLLLPLVFGMLVVIPPQIYCERLYHQQQYDSLLDFYPTTFTSGSYPQGNLSWHHLWYIPYIWTYSIIMLPLFVWLRSGFGRAVLAKGLGLLERPWMLFLIFVPASLSDTFLRPIWPGDANNLFDDWGNFTHKLTFFVAGFVLASGTKVYDVIAAHRRWFLICGIGSFALLQPIWANYWHVPARAVVAYRFLFNFQIWMWILAVLGYGRRYLSFNHAFLRYANEAVYPFYILHQTVIIILAYNLVYVNWGIAVKFPLVAVATFLICWTIYAWAIKPWNLLRVAFGMKWVAASKARAGGNSFNAEPQSRRDFAVQAVLGALVLSLLVMASGCSHREGTLLSCTIQAPSLSTNSLGIPDRQHLAVYLPPSYSDKEKRFPVLYLLPNFTACLWRYTGGSYQGFHLRKAMDTQIASGAAREMIIVVPNTVHMLGGSWYHNSPLTGNWEDYVVEDVVRYVDGHFRTIPGPEARALAGHGMGGTGSLELGLKHPDTFGCVYAMSPAIFDTNGLADFGILSEKQTEKWKTFATRWQNLNEPVRRKAFRDYIQEHLNSPSREVYFEGLQVSYAAAFAADLSVPYPHIALPSAGISETAKQELTRRYERGFGGWTEKLPEYRARGRTVRSITIEYAKDDDYAWIRRGAGYLSGLMSSLGITNCLVVNEGSHESTLGKRLETAMLPTVSNVLVHE